MRYDFHFHFFFRTWNMVYATQVSGRLTLNSPMLNIWIPQVSSSPSSVPSSFSLGVSTPKVGKRSPVKLFVCDSGLFTPLICDMGGPRGDRERAYCPADCWPAAALAATSSGLSSTRSDGKSNSCCLSARSWNECYIIYSFKWISIVWYNKISKTSFWATNTWVTWRRYLVQYVYLHLHISITKVGQANVGQGMWNVDVDVEQRPKSFNSHCSG